MKAVRSALERDSERGSEQAANTPAPAGVPQGAMTPAFVMGVQRTAGNAAAQRMLTAAPGGVLARDTPPATAAPVSAQTTAGAPSAAPAAVPIAMSSSVQDAKSAVIAELENLTRQQMISIETLQQTAGITDPHVTPIAEAIIMGLLTAAVTTALGGLAGAIAERITLYAAAYGGQAAGELLMNCEASAKAINDFLKDQLKSGTEGLYGRVTASSPPDTSPQIAFFDRQRRMYSELGADRVTLFTNAAGQRYDSAPHDEAIVSLGALKGAIRSVAQQEGGANGSTYRAALSQYANLLAEMSLGRTSAGQHAAGEQDAARLTAGGGDGVLNLQVRMDGWRPAITSAGLRGMNHHLRDSFADRPISELGMNVRVTLDNGTWITRNTGGTVGYGPDAPGVAGSDRTLNFVHHYVDPSDDTQLWAMYSLAGGDYGITRHGQRLQYHEVSLWEDDDDHARQRDIDDTWANFRAHAFEGARVFIEQEILPLRTPHTIGE